MEDAMRVNEKEYRILKLLGHGKGGYSYLAEREGMLCVLKRSIMSHVHITHLATKSRRSRGIIIGSCEPESEFRGCWT